jgi:hypothetical protein
MLRFLMTLACGFWLLGSATRPVVAQVAAAFGTASPAPHALRRAPEVHYGVFCIQNSGFEYNPSRVSTTRNPIPIPPLDFSGSSEKQRADFEDWKTRQKQRESLLQVTPNDISADEWAALLRQYDEFEKELGAAGILSTTFAEGHKRLLQLSQPDLAPLLNADKSAKEDVTRLLRQNTLVEREREFNKLGPIDESSRRELAMSFGLKPEQVERHHALDEYLATPYREIYIRAIESNLIDTTVASRLYSRTMYFENVKLWGMTPKQMRSQIQAELALALFKEKRYSEAKVAAYQSLAALGNTPEPYLVTDQDDDGHRTVRFSKNLAFVIAKFSDFKIADQTSEAAAGLRSAVELLEYSAPLDHMLWYLLENRQWAAGKETYEQLLDHFALNMPLAANPKLPVSSFSRLAQPVGAFWGDSDDGKAYFTLSPQVGEEKDIVTVAISGGGGGEIITIPATAAGAQNPPPPPPSGPQFRRSRPGAPRQLGLIPGKEARDRLLKHLREEIDKHSTEKVALFAVLKEQDGFRVIAPQSRVAMLKDRADRPLQEFDTFMISDAAVTNISALDPDHPMMVLLRGLNGAALTMYSAPHTIRPGKYQAAADDFAFKLAAAHRDLPIFRDYFTPQTIPRSEALQNRVFGQPSGYVVLTPSKDTKIKDWNIVNDVRPIIDPLNIPVLTYDGANASQLGERLGGKDLNIILVTAHSAPELQAMIYDLGSAGAFKDNIVIFMSCSTEVTRHLTEYMGGQGARGVVVTDSIVERNSAASTLASLFRKFRDEKSSTRPFRDVVFEAFQGFGGVISVSWMAIWGAIHG